MVDRATRYKNAANQIQERKKPGQTQIVDVPDNTQERQVKGVRAFIGCRVHYFSA
jgi:hypothetical protein